MSVDDVVFTLRIEDRERAAEQIESEKDDIGLDLVDFGATVRDGTGPEVPLGGRGTEFIGAGLLVISIARPLLSGALSLVNAWITQRRAGSVTVELNGEKMVLEGTDLSQQQKLIDEFVARHRLEISDDGSKS